MSTTEGSSDPTPTVLGGRYEIHRKIARGGMAEVYLARDRSLDRPVAVKVLFPEYATDPAFVERFRREAQAAANLSHPNIAGVYDWGTEAGTYFIVMEYVEGQSLAEVGRASGPLHPRRAAEIAFEVAGALGFAHSKGVVHRDVKPGNVLIAPNGTCKVVDFGIARALSSPSEELTQAGSVMGTATYFSPEQAQGFQVDARSDLYSLGVVMFEMVCGRPPFTGDTPVAIAYKHVQEPPPRPSSLISGLPAGLEAIIGKLLAKHPDNRYRSAEDLRADLRRFLDDATPLALTEQQQGRPVAPLLVDPSATQVAVPVTAAPLPVVPDELNDEEWEDEEPPTNRTALFAGLLIVLLLIAAGLVFWLVKSLNTETATGSDVDVPSVIGQNVATARATLEGLGFVVRVQPPTVDPNAPSPTFVPDQVIDQTPKPPAQAAKGSTITLDVFTAPVQAVIPSNLKGKSEADARKALADAKFTNVTTAQVEDVTELGRVVGTDPAMGTSVATDSPIILQISKGPPQVAIPDVRGKSVESARKALEKAGFVVNSATVDTPSADVSKGKVVGTDPATTAPKSSTLDLLVSVVPAPVAVPSVVGNTEAGARSDLSAKGFGVTVKFQTVPSDDPNDGRVISQDPPAGQQSDAGATVTLSVGRASKTTTTSATTTVPSTTTTAEP